MLEMSISLSASKSAYKPKYSGFLWKCPLEWRCGLLEISNGS